MVKMSSQLNKNITATICEDLHKRFPYLYFKYCIHTRNIVVYAGDGFCRLESLGVGVYDDYLHIDSDEILQIPSAEKAVEILSVYVMASPKLFHMHSLYRKDESAVNQGIRDLYNLISSLPGSKEYDEAEARFEAMKN